LKNKLRNTLVLLSVLVMILLLIQPQQEVVYSQSRFIVRQGDTLWYIANRNGLSVNELTAANPGINPNRLQVGQEIIIPAAGAQSVTSSGSWNQNLELLARVIAAEARGEPYIGQVAVGAVILNRVGHSGFPNTLSGVIYQPHAFESVSNGLIWRRNPTAQERQAALDAMNGWDPTYGCLFFWNPYKPVSSWIWTRTIIVQYGNHVFGR
jgi:N-acetylmuramoyl-L-alanine amidase